MDYVVGSVAALISGNVTPNRPRIVKRALTPMKHQASPNVTPKSESVLDRSIFLSPTLQKKKAIVKKSPKRIFQNPDLEVTNDGVDGSLTSPKADKVKKHLKDELEAEITANSIGSKKSSKHKSLEVTSPKKQSKKDSISQIDNERSPSKKKKQRDSVIEDTDTQKDDKENIVDGEGNVPGTAKSPKKKRKSISAEVVVNLNDAEVQKPGTPKKKKKRTESHSSTTEVNTVEENTDLNTVENIQIESKKKKKRKFSDQDTLAATSPKQITKSEDQNSEDKQLQTKTELKVNKKKHKKKAQKNISTVENTNPSADVTKTKKNKNKLKLKATTNISSDVKEAKVNKKMKGKSIVNPNAITDKDTDSEHDSDDEIESETEEANKEILDTGPVEDSSDEEEPQAKNSPEKAEPQKESKEEVQRTLFVGNVVFSSKCKKELKKIFNKYGHIETVRIRTIPVKDGRQTPKLAVIKSELHPDRTTVNVYIKFQDPVSVAEALAENNTLYKDLHLRVTRSDRTGADHDPHRAIFVGNLPFGIEDEGLRAKFEKCGEIESVRVVRDKQTQAGKGFGYVNFASKDGVELALAMPEEDLTIKNRIIRVQRCSQHPQKQGGKFNQRKIQSSQGKFQNKGFRQGQNDNNRGFRQGGNENRGFRQGGNDNRGFRQGGNDNRGFRQGGNDNRGFRQGQGVDMADGAYKRIMNKRKHQGDNEGPPNKRPNNINQPGKEKKPRKEFVGMTSEKKKKHKVKGDKKKKKLSEILTK